MKRYFIAIAMSLCCMTARAQVLNAPQVIQQQDQWCWDACSKCILNYYGDSVQQCAIAEYARTVITWHSFGTTPCCSSADSGCNYWNYNWGNPGSIEDIILHFDTIVDKRVYTALTISQIDSETLKNHLFVEHWSWSTGGGHFVVGHGIMTSGSNTTVYYMNPWFGEGLHFGTYNYMLSGNIDSMGDHTWDLTNTIVSYPHKAVVTGVDGVAQLTEDGILYPNPSTGKVWIKGKVDDLVEVYSATGSLVYSAKLTGSASKADLENLAKGIYIVKIRSANGNAFSKLLLQ